MAAAHRGRDVERIGVGQLEDRDAGRRLAALREDWL